MKSAYIAFILALGCVQVFAQGKFWDSKDAYLGQAPPTDTPRVFAKGMFADTGSWRATGLPFRQTGRSFTMPMPNRGLLPRPKRNILNTTVINGTARFC